jgi:acylphosphatase
LRRVRVLVDGRVQRVGYRYVVANLARERNVKGYVRNLDDGRVEIVAEGEEKELEDFLARIQVKEEPIIVERIEVHEEKPTGEFKTFRIVTGSLEEEMVEGFGTGASYLMLMLRLQKEMIGMQKEMIGMQKETLKLQNETLSLQRETLKLQRETLEEVRGLRQDLVSVLNERLRKLEEDVAKIKAKLGI